MIAGQAPSLAKRIRLGLRSGYYRLAHPDLFDDGAHRARLELLQDRLTGRTVALVGNGEGLFSRCDGAEIDSNDFVVRLNQGFVRDPLRQGSRTDIVCGSMPLDLGKIKGAFRTVEIVYAGPFRWYMSDDLWAERRRITYLPISDFRALAGQLGGWRPSTGLAMMDFLLHRADTREVRLFGFDWKRTKTFYETELRLSVHNWAAERQVAALWSRQGRLRMPPEPADL